MKPTCLLLAFLICSACFISCKRYKEDFSVQAPAGWVKTDSIGEEKHRKVVLSPAQNDSNGIVTDDIRIVMIRSGNIDEYIELLVPEVKKNADIFKPTGNGTLKVDDHTCKWIQHLIRNKNSVSVVVEQRVYFIEESGIIYMIVCTTKEKGLKEMQPAIDKVLGSFKIIPA